MKFKEMNLPNKLTTIRMFCVPIVIVLFALFLLNKYEILACDVYLFNIDGNYLTLLQVIITVLFVFASITDFVDGFIARRFGLVSDYGKLMDPLADKLLVNSTLVCMIASSMFIPKEGMNFQTIILLILVVISLGRDIFVDALRMQAVKKEVVVPANLWGKLKTATLMPGVAITICGSIHPIVYYVGIVLVGLGTIYSIIGGFNYFSHLKKYIGE